MISDCINCENCIFCNDKDIKKYARSRNCKRFVESRITTTPNGKFYYFTGYEMGLLLHLKCIPYGNKYKKRTIRKIKRLYNVDLKIQPTEDFKRNAFITDLNGAIILNNALKGLKHGKK